MVWISIATLAARVSFPAYTDFGKDVRAGYARWRVYMHLVHAPVLNHAKAVDVKITALAASIPSRGDDTQLEHGHISRRKAAEAIDWLVRVGYLVEHAKDRRGVRSLTLAWELKREDTAAA